MCSVARAAHRRDVRAERLDISHNPDTGRWYVDASWGYRDLPVPSLESLHGSSVLGIDLNAGHLAGCVTDPAATVSVGESMSVSLPSTPGAGTVTGNPWLPL